MNIKYRTEGGIEVIDDTVEAEIRLEAMEYLEERFYSRRKHINQPNIMKRILHKFAVVCGIL